MPTVTAELDHRHASGSPRPASLPIDTLPPFRVLPRLCGYGQRLSTAAARPIPSASVTAFRVAFGALIVYSTIRFIARGWVSDFYVDPRHHLTYADFSWVRPLPGPLMYAHMVVLAVLGLAIAVGYRTRLAAALFAVGFAYVELIDAALYLNHYWFVTLAAVVLAIAPSSRRGVVPAVTVWALRGQLAVVYVFAGVAKLNTDWLWRAEPMHTWLSARTDRPLIGAWFDEISVAFVFSWAGALFDLTIVGWLLWRRSRPFAYIAVVCFHVATAMLFQIGVFPWAMIALTPVFFAPDWPVALGRAVYSAARRPATRRLATRRPATPVCVEELVDRSAKSSTQTGGGLGCDVCVEELVDRSAESSTQAGERVGTGERVGREKRVGWVTAAALGVLAVVNIGLPLRHYAAEGNVRFNDDGYYLSWRVMLTERAGFLEFDVVDQATGWSQTVRPDIVLEEWQIAQAETRPDLILATAHLIAADFAEQGRPEVEVYANSWVAINGRARQRWIDPQVDLAALDRSAPAARYVLPIDDAGEDDRRG